MSWHSTEWHQFMAMAAYEYYMQTGDTQLASSFWDLLVLATYSHCADKSVSASGLVDFTHCSRDSSFWPTTRDNIYWPMNSRDGYVNTNRSTEVNAFMCALESAERERERGRERDWLSTTSFRMFSDAAIACAGCTHLESLRSLVEPSEQRKRSPTLSGWKHRRTSRRRPCAICWLTLKLVCFTTG